MAILGSILIADDEETFCESTSRLLRHEGFECTLARDADEAIGRLRRHRFDLLMADIRMPRNPDLRVIREARELDNQMPVILVTGYPSTETAIQSVEMSVVAYLTKPLDFDELVAHVRMAIACCRNRRTLSAIRGRLSSCISDLEAMESIRLPRKEEVDGLGVDRNDSNPGYLPIGIAGIIGKLWSRLGFAELVRTAGLPATTDPPSGHREDDRSAQRDKGCFQVQGTRGLTSGASKPSGKHGRILLPALIAC